MGLPEWCQTHSFKDFLNLIDERNNMNDTAETQVVAQTEISPELDKVLKEEIAEGTPVISTEEYTG